MEFERMCHDKADQLMLIETGPAIACTAVLEGL